VIENEICPNCGNDSRLEEATGWCKSCSDAHRGVSVVCSRCNKPRYSDPCSSCKEDEWLERNADAIERYIIAGLPYKEAKRRVKNEQAPICLSCGDRILGTTEAYFCKKRPECKRAKRIYRHKRDYYRLSVQEALTETIKQLTGEYERHELLRAL
jgi:hypothetical protein